MTLTIDDCRALEQEAFEYMPSNAMVHPETWGVASDHANYKLVWDALLARRIPRDAEFVFVEVGVDLGTFGAGLTERWPGMMLIGVDSYPTYHEDNNVVNTGFDEEGKRVARADAMATALGHYAEGAEARGGRPCASLLHMTSVQAASLFVPNSVAVVWIDANHAQTSVAADIRAWWPVVSTWVSGHDIDHEDNTLLANSARGGAIEGGSVRRALADWDAEVGLTHDETDSRGGEFWWYDKLEGTEQQ